jgi:hypothetical protein
MPNVATSRTAHVILTASESGAEGEGVRGVSFTEE